MAANNIINWGWLIETGRIQEATDKDDYIIVGSFDTTRKTSSTASRTREYLIKIEDFMAAAGGIIPGSNIDVCDITMTPESTTLGAPLAFEKLDGSVDEDEIIPGVLTIARGDSQSIYNSDQEGSYNFFDSPVDTEWNSIWTDGVLNGFGDLSNLKDRTYDTFVAANAFAVGNNVIGLPLVCHVISTDQYFLFTFDAWTQGGVEGGAGFGYTRTEVFFNKCTLTFSDGTTMDTAPVIPVDSNTWDMNNVAFVSATGDDLTAVNGDGNKPFATFGSAFANSNYVWVNPGIYSATIDLPINQGQYFMHCPTGVEFRGTIRDPYAITNRTLNVSGNAIFGDFSNGVQSTGLGTLNIECDKFQNVRTVLFNFSAGTININCNSVLANCFNGGGYGMSARSSSKTYINVKSFYHSQHTICSFFTMGAGAEFVMTCPDIKIIPNYTASYGTAGKSMYIPANVTGGKVIINGRNENTDPSTPVAEGVIKAENCVTDGGFTMTVNGSLIGNVTRCFRPWYRAAYGTYTINGDLISNSSPIYGAITGWSGAALVSLHVKGGYISGQANVVGRGKEFFFSDCKIEHISGGPLFASDLGGNLSPDPKVFTYNCSLYSSALGGSLSFSGFGGTSEVGTVNTTSTEPYGATNPDVFSPSGFTQVIGLVIPKF